MSVIAMLVGCVAHGPKALPAPASPAFEPAGIRETIHSHDSEIRDCHRTAAAHRPGVHGRISVKLFLTPEGKVQALALTESTVADAELEACVLGRVQSWTFTRTGSPGSAVFTYPFVFSRVVE